MSQSSAVARLLSVQSSRQLLCSKQFSKSFNFKIINLWYNHQGLWRSMDVTVIFVFLNCGHLKKPNLPKSPPKSHDIDSINSLDHDPVVPSMLVQIRSKPSNELTMKTYVHTKYSNYQCRQNELPPPCHSLQSQCSRTSTS